MKITLFAATALLAAIATPNAQAACATQNYGRCGSKNDGVSCCPDTFYCQPWDPGYYQCMPQPAKCSKQRTNVDYLGNDLQTVYSIQPDECCKRCSETPGCVGYTFINSRPGPPACYLKSAIGKETTVVGAVSGIVNSVLPNPDNGNNNGGNNNGGNNQGNCGTPKFGNCGNSNGASCCPTGQYCQPWSPQYYQCMDAPNGCPSQLTDTDYEGNDLKKLGLGSPGECCEACKKENGCKAYTFINYNADGKARCYLKSGSGKKQAKVGAVSAMVSVPTCPVQSAGQCGSDKTGVSCCPSGEYCQPWNPGYYQCRPAPQQCAAQEVGVDYNGDDIKTIESILPWECCSRCAETLGCKAYTFVNYNSNGKSACYLKSGTGKKQAKVGAVSSTVLNPKQSACSVSTNVDFYGNDLRTEVGLSPEQCCDKCRATSGCAAFTHVYEPTRAACYLKTKAANNKYYAGAVSGVVN